VRLSHVISGYTRLCQVTVGKFSFFQVMSGYARLGMDRPGFTRLVQVIPNFIWLGPG